jgi:hypothetical protein
VTERNYHLYKKEFTSPPDERKNQPNVARDVPFVIEMKILRTFGSAKNELKTRASLAAAEIGWKYEIKNICH